MTLNRSFLSLLSWIAIANGYKLFPCKKRVENATFDLCPLQATIDSQLSYYEVYDNNSIPGVRNFSYIFNVMGSIMSEPPYEICHNESDRAKQGLPLGKCTKIVNGTCEPGMIKPITNITGAYQMSHGHVNRDKQACFRLHDGNTPMRWDLLDTENGNPARGIVLTYRDGDWCQAGGRNRELRLRIECTDRVNNYPDREESIIEEPTCVYTVKLKSVHGCPTECPVVSDLNGESSLCNGKGICDFDWSNNHPKCYCYEGYYGHDCVSTIDAHSKVVREDDDSGYIAGLVVVIILLVVTGAILSYLFVKFQKLSTDPQAMQHSLKSRQKGAKRGHARLTSIDEDADEQSL